MEATRAGSRSFYRSRDNSVFLGVCGGIAEYFDFSPGGVRLLFVLLQFTFVPILFLIYIVLGLVMKREPAGVETGSRVRQSGPRGQADALQQALERFEMLDKRLQRLESVVTSTEFDLESEYKKL